MSNHTKFFINGLWVEPATPSFFDVINPATEEVYTQISLGSTADVDRAVSAAKEAFLNFSLTTREERVALLMRILATYNDRYEDVALAVSEEMGAPISFARDAQAWAGRAHLESTIEALEKYEFVGHRGTTAILKEPIGVCALITPWNWPLNQIMCKVAPAIAAGCTVVLKPSEIAPISAIVFAEIMEAAGTPAGVFNLVNGNGPDVGQVLASHRDVDLVSFTGSTRAGVMVAKAAADTVKRVAQELGGKSANIILPDADFEVAVAKGIAACFSNTGQSCDAPTRMLVPATRLGEVEQIAATTAAQYQSGAADGGVKLGPVVSQLQYDKIQHYIKTGLEEGAKLLAGGVGRPEDRARGYYVKPSVFSNVTSAMAIAREEIFGPVLAILAYDTVEDAIAMANDTVYGLAAYVQSSDPEQARKVAKRLRAGSIYLNYPEWDTRAPFGGYKQSGNGREYADWGLHDFLEIKGVVGWDKP